MQITPGRWRRHRNVKHRGDPACAVGDAVIRLRLGSAILIAPISFDD
jgi:hypothetical protein